MTAEVAVLNKLAIAVAADSAVTRGRNKVHVSANKIFQIHKTQPLGILIYNYAEIFGYPWELVIKTFREQISERQFRTVKECKDRFLDFLKHPALLTEDVMQQDVMLLALDRLNHFLPDQELPSRTFNAELSSRISRYISSTKNEGDNQNDYSLTKFRRNFGDICRIVCDAALSSHQISAKNKTAFITAVHKFIASREPSSYHTGFAIFGYGSNELLPALEHVAVDGAPFGTLRTLREQDSKIRNSPGQGSQIFAFAQREAASLFMEGISLEAKRFFHQSMQRSLEGFAKRIFDELTPQLRDPDETHVSRAMIDKQIKDFMTAYRKQTGNFVQRNSVRPVLSSIDGLGKEDMAKLAESIVELASIKKRVSNDIETVGGPIDVAVISKNDGFVWIKRKHYFNFDLNRSFYMKYHEKRFDFGDEPQP